MWVFIRPGVVRSANGSEVKLWREFCPIHRFDGNYQFLDLLQMRCSTRSVESGSGWNCLRSTVGWRTVGSRSHLVRPECRGFWAACPYNC
jgi:hypothetical protein